MKKTYRVPKKDRTRESASASEVMRILTGNGLGFILSKMPFTRKRPADWGKRLRVSFEELGPTYIKLGQMMTTRYDILPPEVIQELSKLQENVPPFSSKVFMKVLQESLGDLDRHFEYISPEPHASASIAQVHRARLKDGREVVIKLRRPGIEKTVREDIGTLKHLLYAIDKLPQFKHIDMTDIVEEFGRRIQTELDFISEARAMNDFNDIFSAQGRVRAPRPFMELCRDNVLVMEYIPGITLSKVFDGENRDIPFEVDRKQLINTMGEALLDQVFLHGFIHDDPHPGNLMVTRDQVLYFLDFGTVTHINRDMQRFLLEYVLALAKRDTDSITEIVSERFHMERSDTYAEDLKVLYSKFYGKALGDINIGDVMKESFRLNYKHRVNLPTQFFFMGRIIILVEGMAKKLDPDFDFTGFIQDYFDRERTLKVLLRRFRDLKKEGMWNLLMMPREAKSVKKLLTGKMQIQFALPKIERRMDRFIRAVNALAIAIIMAGLLVSMNSFTNSFWPRLGIVVLSLYIVYELMRSHSS